MIGFQSQVVGQMLDSDLQETHERQFAKKHLHKYLDTAMEDTYEEAIDLSTTVVAAWLDLWLDSYTGQCNTEAYWKTKTKRLKALKNLDLRVLVRDILGVIALTREPTLLVSIAGQSAARLGWSDRRESLLTVSELLAVLATTKAFDITRSQTDRMLIESNMQLPVELTNAIERSQFLPPMISCPEELTSNYQSAYRTFNDCLILGKGNAHEHDICIDVINLQNSIPLTLDTEFLSKVEEEPNPGADLSDQEKHRNWMQFKIQSYQTYIMMQQSGNKFYIPHKVDCRLRLYSQGYHINPQGPSMKKAMISFYETELVDGYKS